MLNIQTAQRESILKTCGQWKGAALIQIICAKRQNTHQFYGYTYCICHVNVLLFEITHTQGTTALLCRGPACTRSLFRMLCFLYVPTYDLPTVKRAVIYIARTLYCIHLYLYYKLYIIYTLYTYSVTQDTHYMHFFLSTKFYYLDINLLQCVRMRT